LLKARLLASLHRRSSVGNFVGGHILDIAESKLGHPMTETHDSPPYVSRSWLGGDHDRSGKGLQNERSYPYVVELAVAAEGLDVTLSRRIMIFHKLQSIQPKHGRRNFGGPKGSSYRWCFSDLATARAFIAQFGGALCK
jgi:hypothetical protein